MRCKRVSLIPMQALLLIKPGNEPTNARARAWPRVKCSRLKSGRTKALPALPLAPALHLVQWPSQSEMAVL